MGLKEQIKDDIKTAMRNKENQKRDTLRNIQTAIKQIEVDERREIGDEEVEKILMKYTKQREEALAQFAQAGRDDLVAKEKEELMIVQSYLPEPLSDEELESILREIITATGATTVKDMGKVMSAAKESIGSKADGSRINQIVKKLLA
jgi:uncharacterized protein YqeY